MLDTAFRVWEDVIPTLQRLLLKHYTSHVVAAPIAALITAPLDLEAEQGASPFALNPKLDPNVDNRINHKPIEKHLGTPTPDPNDDLVFQHLLSRLGNMRRRRKPSRETSVSRL